MISLLKIFSCLMLTNTFLVNTKKVEALNSDNFYYYEEAYIYDDGENIYINNELLTSGTLIDCSYTNNSVYFLVNNNNKYQLGIYTDTLNIIDLDFIPVKIKATDKIYIIGNKDNDAYIEKRMLNGSLISSASFGGSGKESFNGLIVHDKDLLLVGSKDAVSLNSNLKNVGQDGETKAFMLKLDKSLRLIEEAYFDEKESYEAITSFNYDKNINLIINNKIFFTLNDDFSLIKKVKNINLDEDNLLLSDSLYISNGNRIRLKSLDKGIDYLITENEDLIASYITRGGLRVITKCDSLITIYDIKEYHFIKKEPLYLSRSSYDLKSTSSIICESIFGDIDITFDRVDEYFEHRISGTYSAIYNLIFLDGTKIDFKNDIVIEDYVNIIDNGIYNSDLCLDFFGYAKLDGELVYNGVTPSIGEHILELSNKNGDTKKYHFMVVEDYYKENDLDYDLHDICLNKNSSCYINYQVNKHVDRVVINNEDYPYYIQDGDILKIKINSSNIPGLNRYMINKIVLEGKDILLNDLYKIRTLNSEIEIIPTYSTDKNTFFITYDINDLDRSFCYIKKEIINDGKAISDILYKNTSSNITFSNITFSNPSILSFSLCSDLGDGIIITEPLFELEANNNTIEYNISFLFNEAKLYRIELNTEIKNSFKDVKKLVIGKQNISLLNKTRVINPFLKNIIIISISLLFIGSILGATIILILKRRKIKL